MCFAFAGCGLVRETESSPAVPSEWNDSSMTIRASLQGPTDTVYTPWSILTAWDFKRTSPVRRTDPSTSSVYERDAYQPLNKQVYGSPIYITTDCIALSMLMRQRLPLKRLATTRTFSLSATWHFTLDAQACGRSDLLPIAHFEVWLMIPPSCTLPDSGCLPYAPRSLRKKGNDRNYTCKNHHNQYGSQSRWSVRIKRQLELYGWIHVCRIKSMLKEMLGNVCSFFTGSAD